MVLSDTSPNGLRCWWPSPRTTIQATRGSTHSTGRARRIWQPPTSAATPAPREGGWLLVRDCYRAGRLPGVPPVRSNEPIGPGSSVSSENDPIKLYAAAAFAFIANLPACIFRSSAGVYARARFEDTHGISAFGHLRRIPLVLLLRVPAAPGAPPSLTFAAQDG